MTNTTLLFCSRQPFPYMQGSSLLVTDIATLYTCDSVDVANVLGMISGPVSVGFNTKGKVDYIGTQPTGIYKVVVKAPKGCIAMPGLVDCHTHTVWAGSRSHEFSQRLAGTSYMKILEGGGGIKSTVDATRRASLEELVAITTKRLQRMLKRGVTTVEIKSGYGLNVHTEEKILTAARKAAEANAVPRVFTTFLGAHVVPKDVDRSEYVRQVVEEQLPVCVPLCDAIDVFCDKGAFTLDEANAILSAGKAYGLKIKAHAEQIEHTGVAELVAELDGVSVDHLERLDEHGIAALKRAGTVAVFSPGAQLYLKDSSPPTTLLRQAGVKIAVATDFNPGTSPVHDLMTAATLACLLQGLTIEEAVLGITRNAGLALGETNLGYLAVNESVGDMVLIKSATGEPASVDSVVQHMNGHDVMMVIKGGKIVYQV